MDFWTLSHAESGFLDTLTRWKFGVYACFSLWQRKTVQTKAVCPFSSRLSWGYQTRKIVFFEHVVLVTVVLKSLLQLTVCFCAVEFYGAVFVVISADLPSIRQSWLPGLPGLPGQLLDINCCKMLKRGEMTSSWNATRKNRWMKRWDETIRIRDEKKSYVMTWNWTSEGKMRCGECGKSWNGIEMRKITSNLYIMRLGFFKMFFLHPKRRKWLMQSFVPCCLQIISNCL